MKIVCIVFTLLNLSLAGTAQSLRTYPIGNTGCSVYLFCDPGEFELNFREDSSRVFTAKCLDNKTTYGVILVELLHPTDGLETAVESVKTYMDYLKDKFEIHGATGYGTKIHRLKNNETTRGLLDHWVGSDGSKWKVKAWTDGKFIAVLYVRSNIEIDESKRDLFLDGFTFPAM